MQTVTPHTYNTMTSKKDFWKLLAQKGPIVALAPMDGYTDSPYRQIVKKIAPETVVFSEFYSADGLMHSKELQKKALTHDPNEYPLIIQIFGKDPHAFAEAAKIIEGYGITGIDVNMGCPAKKVVKSGHGSSLMIERETAFHIIEAMSHAVQIPISVKTRLWWEDASLLTEFCLWLENAGANLITVHGRTYKQAFSGNADFTAIYELKKHLHIPILANGDIESYDDGITKIFSWDDRLLDGFMIGRASFGNPWCFLPWPYIPTLWEVLDTMEMHGKLLFEWKGKKWMLEARKHLVQYIHGLTNAKEYRNELVHVESVEDIITVIQRIHDDNSPSLDMKMVDT